MGIRKVNKRLLGPSYLIPSVCCVSEVCYPVIVIIRDHLTELKRNTIFTNRDCQVDITDGLRVRFAGRKYNVRIHNYRCPLENIFFVLVKILSSRLSVSKVFVFNFCVGIT